MSSSISSSSVISSSTVSSMISPSVTIVSEISSSVALFSDALTLLFGHKNTPILSFYGLNKNSPFF